MTKKSKKKKTHPITLDPDYKPYIVMNEYLQVWTGLRDGGRSLAFSNNLDDAKPLDFETQFKHLKRIYPYKLEQIYL